MTAGPSPGWYRDSSARWRWWDGFGWWDASPPSSSVSRIWMGSASIAAGTVLAVIGASLWLFVSGPSGECQSGLGQLARQLSSQAAHDCQVVDAIHLLALPALAVGVVLVAIGAVAVHGGAHDSNGEARARPSGWYEDPGSPGFDQWWDGQSWTGFRRPHQSR